MFFGFEPNRGLIRALAALWDAQSGPDWTDRVIYL